MNRRRALTLFFAALLVLPATASRAADAISPFVGEYRGRSIDAAGTDLSERDLHVKILRRDDGFEVRWTTIKHTPQGDTTKSYAVTFIPTRRENIFTSAMKTNVFGGREAHDPLKGDPLFWARIRGRTLTIFGMLITDDGGYEMQTYDRILTEQGMELQFSRVRNGEVLRAIRGELERIGG